MGKEIRVGWEPFATMFMTVEQVEFQLRWACDRFTEVSPIAMRFVGTSKGHVSVGPRHSNDYGGLAGRDWIRMSTVRDMSGRDNFVFGGIFLHELGHTHARYSFPKLAHTPNDSSYQDWLMHPYGSKTDYFHPEEVLRIQSRGRVSNSFWPHDVQYLGRTLRRIRKSIQDLVAARKASRDKEEKERLSGEIKAAHRQRVYYRGLWLQRIALWRKYEKRISGLRLPTVKISGTLSVESLPSKPDPIPCGTNASCRRCGRSQCIPQADVPPCCPERSSH